MTIRESIKVYCGTARILFLRIARQKKGLTVGQQSVSKRSGSIAPQKLTQKMISWRFRLQYNGRADALYVRSDSQSILPHATDVIFGMLK